MAKNIYTTKTIVQLDVTPPWWTAAQAWYARARTERVGDMCSATAALLAHVLMQTMEAGMLVQEVSLQETGVTLSVRVPAADTTLHRLHAHAEHLRNATGHLDPRPTCSSDGHPQS